MITPAIRYISSFQDATNSSSIPVPTPVMVDGRIWDQKNLNVSSYRSGRTIPQVKTGWSTLTTGAWRYYNDNPASAAVYGRLYNWYALMGIYDAASLADPSLRDNIAPVDWDVATYGEWITLRNILGKSTAAIALKESGPAHWGTTNTATNSSYFTALPGGYKYYSNNTGFNRLGSMGFWWSKDGPSLGYFLLTNTSDALVLGNTSTKNWGFSIRLIKATGTIPNFTTTYPTTITSTSLLGTGGDIPTSYSGIISDRGIVYGTSINPTIVNTKIQSGTGTGSYTVNITGPLSVNTQYYIRAYAISSIDGIVYAPNVSVFTLNSTPTVFTNITSQITTNSAESGGSIDNDGGFSITAKGVAWSTSPNPTVALPTKTNNGSGIEPFVSEITGLALNTKYYVRAYATNSSTTGYGQQEEFTTLAVPSLNLIFNQYYAYHAYSLRQLSDTYNYKCFRVRRTTASPDPITTTTVDVFFNSYSEIGLYSDIVNVSGTATAAITLGEFAQGVVDGLTVPSSIFIVTWYDQSGNGKNVTQSTLNQQPRLVLAGNLELSQGKAAVRFTSTNSQSLFISDTSVSQTNVSTYVVGNAISSTSNTNFFMLNNSNRFYVPALTNIGYQGISTFPVPVTLNTQRLYELLAGSLTTSAYSNGIQLAPTSVPSVSSNNLFIRIGLVGTAYTNGYVSEAISFDSTSNRLNIEPNMMDYYGIQRLPLVTTADVNYIEPTGTTIGGGNLIDEFGVSPTTKGVCWSAFPNPTISSGAVTNDGTGIGAFISSLNFLRAYTQYYARAYAVNSIGVNYGEEKQFTTINAPYVFTLDLFPSAHHAFSLRKLRSAYTGACLRVRRTTTSPSVETTTVDVTFDTTTGAISFNSAISNQTGYFTNATTLGQFASGTVDGFTPSIINVTTWYDQSGNNKNVVSTTTTQQPRLVYVDGVTGLATLETKDGNVAIRFIRASATRLTLTDTSMSLTNLSQYIVTSLINTTASQLFSTLRFDSNQWIVPGTSGVNTNINYNAGTTANVGFICQANDTVNRLYSLVANSTTATGYKNQIVVGSKASTTAQSAYIALGWSGNTFFVNALDGYIQESITWQNQLYTSQIQTSIINYYGI